MRFPGTAWARIRHDLEGIGSLGLTVPAGTSSGRLLNVAVQDWRRKDDNGRSPNPDVY
jgi:hypothetical protein